MRAELRTLPSRLLDRMGLRARLALTFALGSLATLVLVTGALYLAFRFELRARNRSLLEARVQAVAVLLARGAAPGEALAPPPDAPRESGTWIRILRGGTLAGETPGMAERIPAAWIATRTRGRGHRGHHRYLLAELGRGDMRIQGALDVSEDERLLDRIWERAVWAMLLGAAGCAALGGWVAHRGLRPLRDIAARAREIHAHRLKDRLESGRVPAELLDLVQALNGMLDRLDQAFERLGRFSADLAHELRTPLTVLMGEAEVLLARDRTPEEYRQALESSVEECRRLSRLVSRMLFLARAEDPATVAERLPVDAARLAEDAVGYFEALAEEQGVALEGHGQGILRGDADLLRQALANLLSNALEATPSGGRVTVSILGTPDGAVLEVRDTGRGIPAGELGRVQDRFYRTRAAQDGRSPGAGLGLAIVHSIARLHGGTLDLLSAPGQGTTVLMHLPPES